MKTNTHRRNRYERDVQEISDDEHDDAEYQTGDFIRGLLDLFNSILRLNVFFSSACVTHVDTHKEEVQLTIDPSTSRT